MTLTLIEEARARGATLEAACERLGLSARTVQRWMSPETADAARADLISALEDPHRLEARVSSALAMMGYGRP